MRMWTLAFSALSLAVSLSAQHTSAPADANRFTGFTLPVEVAKTIKADKAETGDPVEFHMLEPVLAGNGVVIPAKAKLHGKVVLATGANNGQYSYLALLVDEAEWDGHKMPLNAFLIGWGKQHVIRDTGENCAARTGPQRSTVKTPATAAESQQAVYADCSSTGSDSDEPANWSHQLMARDIEISRDANSGSTLLLSRKNIHLPAGMYVILQNVEPPSVATK